MRTWQFNGSKSITTHRKTKEWTVIVESRIINMFLLAIFTTLPLFSYSQLKEAAIPYSVSAGLKPLSANIKLASNKIEQKSFAERKNKGSLSASKAFYFAERFDVALTPENAGIWENSPSGRVWRLGISSTDAFSIYLTFQSFHLNQGTKLFVYTPGYKELKGAFTEKNNTLSKAFSIAPLSGDHLIIELDLPKGVTEYGSLQLSKVYHGVLNIFGNVQNPEAASSAAGCDQGINCDNGIFWQTEKKAVCKIISDGALSTGTLIANTSKTAEAHVITSQHTMFSEEKATEAVFVFNYENQGCQPGILNDDQALSGATLVARSPGLDYALLKLNEQPPKQFNPYYAGWDSRDNTPAGGTCIHHAGGGHKQIAIDYHPLSTATFNQSFAPNSSWKVNTWDIGTTEPGSSGSALFNPQHRIIGTLTGGYSSCMASGSDFFSKFSLAWNTPTKAESPLKAWLDKANTNAAFMDGYDPYGFNEENCQIAFNIANYEKTDLSSEGQRWGYISGHNSSGFSQFAEKFASPGSLLLPGFYMNVAKASYSSQLSGITIKIWEGSSVPSTEIYSKSIFIKDLKTGVNYVALDSIIKVTGNFFIGYEIKYDISGDSFALYHAARRGITGASSMFVFNGAWHNINTFNSINYSTSLGIGILECYGKTYKPDPPVIIIYPNPSENYINIKIPSGAAIDEVACFNTSGQLLPVIFQPSEVNTRIVFNLPGGLYILRIKAGTQQFTTKFIVQP